MRLYRHSARCPAILRSFLEVNPTYWCFIPLPWDVALGDNPVAFGRNAAVDPFLASTTTVPNVDPHRVNRYMECVPLPPAPYTFSYRQRQIQRRFFEQYLGAPVQQLPYVPMDLYQVAIIAVCKSTLFQSHSSSL